MEKITSMDRLEEAILMLEIKKQHEFVMLKEQVELTYEKLKPANLVKSAVNNLVESPDLKADLINGVMGIAAGYLSKKVAVGKTHNPVKNILGTILQMAVTGIVAKNGDDIKSGVTNLIGSFLTKRKKTA